MANLKIDGNALRGVIQNAGYRMDRLSAICGYNYNYVSACVSKGSINPKAFAVIAQKVGIDKDVLFNLVERKEDPAEQPEAEEITAPAVHKLFARIDALTKCYKYQTVLIEELYEALTGKTAKREGEKWEAN